MIFQALYLYDKQYNLKNKAELQEIKGADVDKFIQKIKEAPNHNYIPKEQLLNQEDRNNPSFPFMYRRQYEDLNYILIMRPEINHQYESVINNCLDDIEDHLNKSMDERKWKVHALNILVDWNICERNISIKHRENWENQPEGIDCIFYTSIILFLIIGFAIIIMKQLQQ